MLYFKCPSCRFNLARVQVPYTIEMAEICNSKMSNKEKDVAKTDLLNKLNVTKYCCRMRCMGFVELINELV